MVARNMHGIDLNHLFVNQSTMISFGSAGCVTSVVIITLVICNYTHVIQRTPLGTYRESFANNKTGLDHKKKGIRG